MTDNFNYTLLSKEDGTYALRSVVTSFGLDHVTDKDIVSFYTTFSQYASFDTGLLPLDGTGILAIRNAGPHTQVVAQHAPGLYYINWGSFEGDKQAKAYYVAQPYRIIIGDFRDGNLLGARMFYSPVPITSPQNQLYHVNLPNINCKGYRGNAVGWICLYHKDDWSHLPFNEKVSRFIERCSGVETYNDANMNETDGPRFYDSCGYPSYITDPVLWQKKSEEEGYQWTLDSSVWIPVKVTGIDNQGCHNPKGELLTLGMAILGNYQAYYTDTEIPKMYNIVSRLDFTVKNDNIADFFKKSFASAPSIWSHTPKDNPYAFTVESRINNSSETLQLNFNSDEEDPHKAVCNNCDEVFDYEVATIDAYDETICPSCINDRYVYVESVGKYFHCEDEDLYYSEHDDNYYHSKHDVCFHCPNCMVTYGYSGTSEKAVEYIHNLTRKDNYSELICAVCFDRNIEENDLSSTECVVCKKKVITSVGWNDVHPTVRTIDHDVDSNTYTSTYSTFCESCSPKHFVCPCGKVKSDDTEDFNSCSSSMIYSELDANNKLVFTASVHQCCASCLSAPILQDGELVAAYVPPPEVFKLVVNNKLFNSTGITVIQSEDGLF